MDTVFIDCHPHQSLSKQPGIFSLSNIIYGRETVPLEPCTLGIHPWYIDTDWEAQIAGLTQEASSSQVLAIGECGLDKVCSSSWAIQVAAFESQIQLAQQLNKPLILHTVRSFHETLALLKVHAQSIKVLFHGFQKNEQLAQTLLDQGYYLSLGAAILSGSKDTLLKNIPLDRILFETDDKSISIIDIYTYFCSVRGVSLAEVKTQIQQNFKTIFKYSIL